MLEELGKNFRKGFPKDAGCSIINIIYEKVQMEVCT